MTTTDHIIRTTRKNKRGEAVPVHYHRPQRAFKKTLDGTDPTSLQYQRSLVRAQDNFGRWLASGAPKKATVRTNAKGTPIDTLGMAITKAPRGALPIEEESLAWLVHWFMRHAQWKALAPSTQGRWGNLLQRFLAEAWPAAGPDAVVGDGAFAALRKDNLIAIRSRFGHIPAQANVMMKAIRAMFYTAQDAGIVTTVNPAARLGSLQEGDGHIALSYAQHLAFTKRWAIGTRQRLVYDLALFSGARVSDLHMLGPQHVEGGWLVWSERKGMNSVALKRKATETKVRHWKLHPDLLASIAAAPHGIRQYAVRGDGAPYAQPDRLSRAIVKWMEAAGIKDRSGHSIRKLGAVLLADLLLIADYLGHRSFAEAQTYIDARNKRKSSQRVIDNNLMDVIAAMKAAA